VTALASTELRKVVRRGPFGRYFLRGPTRRRGGDLPTNDSVGYLSQERLGLPFASLGERSGSPVAVVSQREW